VVLQSLFLWGAAYFKKYSATKTTLVMACIVLVLLLIASMIAWGLYDNASTWDMPNNVAFQGSLDWLNLYVLIAPLAWIFTYRCIAQKEMM
jgi:hypothetical protein